MKTKSMLVRLQCTLGQEDLIQKILLVPQPTFPVCSPTSSQPVINLVVGYTGSAHSQTALDLALWTAHQTRLATGKEVTVHVVYVVEPQPMQIDPAIDPSLPRVTKAKRKGGNRRDRTPAFRSNGITSEQLEQIDETLWRARCLADEWRGSLSTHLRFGELTQELHEVVRVESADLLFLGCRAASHPLVRQLATEAYCPILGIPDPVSAVPSGVV